MATYDIRPLQLCMLKTLLSIDNMCKSHDLHYCIMAGTMIGAVRHKGFIPWDDDIDVGMPRPDYEKFIANSREWLPKPYELICGENDSVYPLPFAKIQDASTTLIERKHLSYLGGVYVDVFPLDAVPSNILVRRIHYVKYEFYKQMLYLVCRDPYKHGHGISSWTPLLCRRLFTLKKLQQSIRHLLTKYDYDKCSLAADYTDGLRGVMSKRVLGSYMPFVFEGKMVCGIKHYDEYLTQIYGDYMKVPDGDHQRQHNFYYLDLNKPYREYKTIEK
jgi:lipopolysaccharide cholinephosphotransferase